MLSSSASSGASSPSFPEAVNTSMGNETLESQNTEKVSKHRPSYFTPKIKFSPNEDMLLLHAVQSLGTGDWHIISSRVPGRNARQCRERWNNYVNPALISAPWTAEEDRFLMEKYHELGPHWRTIASFFASRSTNSIKNRFTILQRRQKKNNRKSKDKKTSFDISMNQNIQNNTKQPSLSTCSVPASSCHPILVSNPISPVLSPMISSPDSSSDDNSNRNDIVANSDFENQNETLKPQGKDDLFDFLESVKDVEFSFWPNDFDVVSWGFNDSIYF